MEERFEQTIFSSILVVLKNKVFVLLVSVSVIPWL